MPGRVLANARVNVEDGRVVDVAAGTVADDADIRLPSGVLVPGLIDLQVNGYYGADFADAIPEQWGEITRRLPATGVTALAPTFISAPVEETVDALRRTAELVAALNGGAEVLGVHLEGPFLSELRKGAHNASYLRDPEPEAVEALLGAAPGLVRIVTLAPERRGGIDAVRRLADAGVLVSIGHSDASGEQVYAAADAGARMVTHLFNAQRPLNHREPGVVGAALSDRRLTAGLIVDLHHVNAEACRIGFAAAPGRIALVTDAAAPAGMPPGRYELGGEPVVLEPGQPVRREDGTIASSNLALDQAIANAVGIGVDLLTVVEAATRIPADLLGRADLGRIAAGARADLVWLGADLRVVSTWIEGDVVHGAGSWTA
ncbi:MAG: N-acetylglucosamine-6-phosphate deacetylase [Pseudonocardiales bacterium]|nr:N-acetylglucosamine-6-phosphate deacetylase [Pseudonocardiales bacterium]